jgi:ankyrin repeat protein
MAGYRTIEKDFIDALNAPEGVNYQNLISLLLFGVNINHKSETHRRKFTALHFAVDRADEKLVKWLLNRGADKTICDDFDKTAVEIAQQRKYENITAIINNFEPLRKIDGEIIYQLNFEYQRVGLIKRRKVLYVEDCNNIHDLLNNQIYYKVINKSSDCFVIVVQLQTKIPFINLSEQADKFDDNRPVIICIESEMFGHCKIFYKDTN